MKKLKEIQPMIINLMASACVFGVILGATVTFSGFVGFLKVAAGLPILLIWISGMIGCLIVIRRQYKKLTHEIWLGWG